MTNFNGSKFWRVDDDAYADDQSQNTALDNFIRNNQIWLAKESDEVNDQIRTDTSSSDGVVQKYSSFNWMTILQCPWVISSRDAEIHSRISYLASSTSDLELRFFVADIGAFGGFRYSDVFTPNNADVPSFTEASIAYNGFSAPEQIMVGWMIRSSSISNTSSGSVVGPDVAGEFGTTPSFSDTHHAFETDFTKSKIDFMHFDGSGYDFTSDSANVSWAPDFRSHGTGESAPITFGELETIIPMSWAVREERPEWKKRWRSNSTVNYQIRPNTPSRFDSGAGNHYRAARSLYQQETHHAINWELDDKPNSNWDRFPSTKFVDGSNTKTWDNPVPMISSDSPNYVVNSNLLVIAVDLNSWDNGEALTGDNYLSAHNYSENLHLDVTCRSKDFDGTVQDTNTVTNRIKAYPLAATSDFPFLMSAFLQEEADTSQEAAVWHEGQLMPGEGDLRLVSFARGAVSPKNLSNKPSLIETEVGGLPSGYRLHIVGSSISWRFQGR